MNAFDSFSLRYLHGKLELLDQRLLPDKEDWVDASEPQTVWKLIRNLSVRGAPMIGVAAAMCLADYSTKGLAARQIFADVFCERSQ
jgi:methylthioribose-1-phosphate isomerase